VEDIMTLSGIVKNGVVVLDNGRALAEGTRVDVVVPEAAAEFEAAGGPTLAGLLNVAGAVRNLPPDFAAQHDHYLHGTPKR
jgi:hypothetical protein